MDISSGDISNSKDDAAHFISPYVKIFNVVENEKAISEDCAKKVPVKIMSVNSQYFGVKIAVGMF